jgi:hypothetical protein
MKSLWKYRNHFKVQNGALSLDAPGKEKLAPTCGDTRVILLSRGAIRICYKHTLVGIVL